MVRKLFLSLLAFCAVAPERVHGAASREALACFRETEALPVPRLSIPEALRVGQSIRRGGQPSEPIIRGQSPLTFETPPIMAPSDGVTPPFNGNGVTDPFLYGPDPVLGNPGGTVLSGINGPQPYRLGHTPRFDYTYLAEVGTKNPDVGDFQSQNLDFELAHTMPVGPGWAFTSTPQVGVRLWEGPTGVDLPGAVFRLGWDLTLATPLSGPWSMQLDFNPSINSDFEESLGSEAWNFDANAMLFYRSSPQWMWVLGAGYWDRVDNILIPYAGVVWNPNDLWEFRLLFPKARASYFLGNYGTGAHWIYATGEYHVESYQIEAPGLGARQQVQLADWRIGLGLRSDHGWYDKSVEVGYVFGRDVEFLHSNAAYQNFEIKDTFMVRCLLRF
jgi:hypothetical protein